MLFVNCYSYAGMEDIDIHGFLSQGYLKTTEYNYLIHNSKDGSFEFNEAAINFSTSLTDNLRCGLQLFSRDFGDQGNNEVKLDWAFLDYNLREEFGIRAGKIKRPMGFYNQGRDVDMGRTSIFLPQCIYNESLREQQVSIQGVSLYGNISLNAAGSVEYDLFYGTINMKNDFPVVVNVYTKLSGSIPSGVKTTYDFARGGVLRWNTPLDELRFGYSFFQSSMQVETENLPTIQLEIKGWHILSAEFIWKSLSPFFRV